MQLNICLFQCIKQESVKGSSRYFKGILKIQTLYFTRKISGYVSVKHITEVSFVFPLDLVTVGFRFDCLLSVGW